MTGRGADNRRPHRHQHLSSRRRQKLCSAINKTRPNEMWSKAGAPYRHLGHFRVALHIAFARLSRLQARRRDFTSKFS